MAWSNTSDEYNSYQDKFRGCAWSLHIGESQNSWQVTMGHSMCQRSLQNLLILMVSNMFELHWTVLALMVLQKVSNKHLKEPWRQWQRRRKQDQKTGCYCVGKHHRPQHMEALAMLLMKHSPRRSQLDLIRPILRTLVETCKGRNKLMTEVQKSTTLNPVQGFG